MTSTTTDRQQAETERRMAVEAAIEDCRARPIREVAAELQLGLEEKSGWLSGPCPVCGGHDRFNINTRDGGFFCRKGCEARGSGPIDLVMVTLRLEFMDAVREMHGDLPEKVTQEELDRRRAQRAKAEEKRAAEAERHREKAIEGARGIWTRARGQGMQPVRDYLALRGLTPERLPELPGCLRYLPDQAYVLKRVVDGRRELVTMHRGPAMIAAIQGPDGRLTCVHQTWFDLSRPKGRPEILWQGERQRNKLTRGSQRRAAIRLITPDRFDTLVMGEGIETTLTAAVAWREALGPEVAYWAGISLGHMAGKMRKIPGKRYSGLPDMACEDGFYPPPWVRRLIFVMDGDSDPGPTRAKLECGIRRAMRLNPGLRGQIVPAGEGVDLNDLIAPSSPAETATDPR
ncbi:hypothetical protein KUV64_13990 [Mameliella alba]|uniref:DUF7146 domain-containing protein n=1 Tax=Mameliella alba TaxID=561184 RepID=UPI001C98E485|nr:hypothetical protein [Mameliella alba]MBY6120244.1 hypothetical protein [Mameliella alba]